MVDFYFGDLKDEKELKLLYNFLLTQHMNYPNYEDWIQETCVPEINCGYKKAILSFAGERGSWQLIGNAIYQKAKEAQLPSTLHFKNLRVVDGFKRGGVASFLIKQVEKAAVEQGLSIIMLDFREERKDVMNLFLWHGYRKLMAEPLYDDNITDIIMIKRVLEPKEKVY